MEKTDETEKACKGAYQKLVEYNAAVVKSWVERSGMPEAEFRYAGPEYAEVGVRVGGKARIFGLCFGKISRKREFRISPRFFDAFGKDDKVELKLLKLLGFFAERMDDVKKELVDAPKAKKLYNAWSRASRALYGR